MRKEIIAGLSIMLASCGAETGTKQNTEPGAAPEQIEKKAIDFSQRYGIPLSDIDMDNGKAVYIQNCASCHQLDGQGIAGVFPPLASSDFLEKPLSQIIPVALNGSKDSSGAAAPITVNGVQYSGGMMSVRLLSNQDSRDVVNYILNEWGNKYGSVTEEDISAIR
jgi:mono/diheme cytochrome c family protein